MITMAIPFALFFGNLIYEETFTRSISPVVVSDGLNRQVQLAGYQAPDFIFGIDGTRYEVSIKNADREAFTDCRVEVDGLYVCKLSDLLESESSDLGPRKSLRLHWSSDMSNARRFIGPDGQRHLQTRMPKTVRLICEEGEITWKLE